MANVAIPANIESQQKTLETFVRSKTKSWIGQVLKTDDDFRDISLEELFANGWILYVIIDKSIVFACFSIQHFAE